MGTSSLRCAKYVKFTDPLNRKKFSSLLFIFVTIVPILTRSDQLSCKIELENVEIVKFSIIKCRRSILDSISKSLATLQPMEETIRLNVSTIDISECDIHTLPNLFAHFQDSIRTVRVANSQVQFVAGNAFTGLENRLKILDLSGNKLVALPGAIQFLKRLESLDISDNLIRVIPPQFTQSPLLKRFDAAFNLLGFTQGGPLGLKVTSEKIIPRLELGDDVFDLTSIAASLQFLDLGFNGLHAIPKQLLDKSVLNFPNLRVLILSGNRISDIPVSLVENLNDLQSLHLDSNLIRTFKIDPFPANIKLVTLKDNPLQCNCDIMWLLDLLFRNSSLTVHLPSCSTPFYIRDLTLSNINDQRLCPTALIEDTVSRAPEVVYVTDRDLALFHLGLFQSLHLMDVQGEVKALFISWKVDPDFYAFPNVEWAIILRSFDTNIYNFNRTQFTLANYRKNQPVKEGSIYSDSVGLLTSNRFYLVCIAAVEGDVHYVHLNNCKGATTLQESLQPVHTSFTNTDRTMTMEITTERQQKTIQLINFHMSATSKSDRIVVEWTVFDPEPVWEDEKVKSPLNFNSLFSRPNYLWRVQLRPFGSEQILKNDSLTDPADALRPNENHTSGTTINGLVASTAYVLCVSLLQTPAQRLRNEQQDQESCLEVATDSKNSGTFSRAQMATAAVASSASAAICTALVALCIQFRNRHKSDDDDNAVPQLPIADLLQRTSSFRLNTTPTASTSS